MSNDGISEYNVTVYYHDTDCGGVVYYANYLKYFEQARTAFFAERSLSVKELADCGTWFVVSRQEVDYKAGAIYGDTLTLRTRIGTMTSVRIEFEHDVIRSHDELVCRAKTVLVCVDNRFKPQAIPEAVRSRLV